MTSSQLKSKKCNKSTFVNNDLCRICLSISDLLIPIFRGEGLEQELHEKIKKYLPVKISKTDVLPQQICYLCAGTIIAWDSLYMSCLKADEKLQSLLNVEEEVSKSADEEIDSDDEVLMPPKKRKPIEVKIKDSKNSLSKPDKSKQRNCFSKKYKKLKSEEKILDKTHERTGSGNELNNVTENDYLDKTNLLSRVQAKEGDAHGKEEDEANAMNADANEEKKSSMGPIKKSEEEMKNSETLQCQVCNNTYKTRANLERHYTKEHLTDQVPCPVCQKSFNSKKLDFHLKSIHGVKADSETEGKFKCKFCEKWFKNKYVRNSHVKEIHLNEPIKCKLCDFEGVRTVLRRHKRDVHAEKRFLCSLCPGAFKTLHTLKMHMTSHSDVRCYTCDVCGMGFKRLNNVRDHMKCHEQKSNQCQICGNFFARKRYLAIHEKTIHNFYADGIVPEERGFECEICGAKLKWKKNLLAHMRIHTGEKPYVCKICNKDFICHGSLRTHMAKHSVCSINEGESQGGLSLEVNAFNPPFKPDQV